jgi:hypothetical protein
MTKRYLQQSLVCALKPESRYESDESEAMEMKQPIEQYKCAAKDALHGLKSKHVEEATVSSPLHPPASMNSYSNGTPEKHTDVDDGCFDSNRNKPVT